MVKAVKIKGRGQLSSALTTTSAVGAYVSTRFEIDTTLCTAWTNPGTSFARWRIKEINFHFCAYKPTTTEGLIGIMILDDPQQTTPSNTANALSVRQSKVGKIYDSLTLRYTPRHQNWLFTRDALTLDDRLEMPGDVVYFSDLTTASYIPGIAWMDYVVEFDEIINVNVASGSTPREPRVTRWSEDTSVLPKDCNVLTEKQQKVLEQYNKYFGKQ